MFRTRARWLLGLTTATTLAALSSARRDMPMNTTRMTGPTTIRVRYSLTRRAKLLMLSESAISAITILLVAARAVNIFK